MSLLFNLLSRLIMAFLPRSKHLLISWHSHHLQWKNKVSHCFHYLPLYLPWMEATQCHDLRFLNVEFKPKFSLASFTFNQRLFSFSLLSAIRVVWSANLRLLIFQPTILIPACASCSPAFHMIYSAYKLNKQGHNIQLWHTPFPIWNRPLVPGTVLTIAYWSAYRFLNRQLRWSGIPISFRISTVYCDPHSQRLWHSQ